MKQALLVVASIILKAGPVSSLNIARKVHQIDDFYFLSGVSPRTPLHCLEPPSMGYRCAASVGANDGL